MKNESADCSLKGIGAGATDFISKPIDIEEVLRRVRNTVYAKQLYDQLKIKNKLLNETIFG